MQYDLEGKEDLNKAPVLLTCCKRTEFELAIYYHSGEWFWKNKAYIISYRHTLLAF